MVLRRPYAFLIKHFKLIHIILFILFAYITFKANNIVTFFKDYILYNGSVGIEMTNYINTFIYIAIFLILIMSITIYYLMKYKKKWRTIEVVE